MIIAVIERFDHKYYIRGELVDRRDHFLLKSQQKTGEHSIADKFKEKFPDYFDIESKENTSQHAQCWCQIITEFLITNGFKPLKFDDQKGLHYFIKDV